MCELCNLFPKLCNTNRTQLFELYTVKIYSLLKLISKK